MNNNITGINPMVSDKMLFDINSKSLELSNVHSDLIYDLNNDHIRNYIDSNKESFKINYELVSDYFMNSNYQDNLILYIVPTDDSFNPFDFGFLIDFSENLSFQQLDINVLEKSYNKTSVLNKIFIYIREESLAQLIINKQPWEDASIGFQMRIKRIPNIYNSKFWYHFTNEYVGSKNFRYSSHCGACNLINQNKKYIL